MLKEYVVYYEVTITSCSDVILAKSEKEAKEMFKNTYLYISDTINNRTNVTEPKIVNVI